jgi:hypothetical protein
MLVVLPVRIDGATGRPPAQSFDAARLLQAALGTQHGVALGVHAQTHGGGRGHLDGMRVLRSMCGEWDLWLALDIAQAPDWQWEAEAAIYHAMPRLALMRVALPPRVFDAHVQTRITERSVRASIDAGFSGLYSIVPSLLPWRWWDQATLAGKCEAAVLSIRALMRHESLSGVVPDEQVQRYPQPRSGRPE